QFKEGRTSCDNEPKQAWPRTSRSDNMVEQVEKVVLEDRRLSVENITSKVGISVGSVHTILHEDLRMRKVSSRWEPRILADDHKAARMAICQATLTPISLDNNLEVVVELRAQIIQAHNEITEDMCRRVFSNIKVHVEEAARCKGGHTEHLIHRE
ncbi:hypothetical protein B7P43_G03469, partial [Cryptotermes secundus]